MVLLVQKRKHEHHQWIIRIRINLQYLTYIIEIKSIPGKIYGNSGMVHSVEINQAPSPYSML